MKSQQILSVINIAKSFGVLPSQVVHLDNEYTAYCFDEACAYILNKMTGDDAKTPRFEEDKDVVRNNTTLEMMLEGKL